MTREAKVTTAGILLGIGLGGFVDGIVLHQILQWHQMLSAALPPETIEAMKRNMAADGWFHAAVWIATLLGWGAFNLVEGIVDHHVLELHHVRDLPQHVPGYDWIFLLVAGVGFVLAGLAVRAGRRSALPAYGAERRSGRERRFSYR